VPPEKLREYNFPAANSALIENLIAHLSRLPAK
jgi:hypothetical protein